MNKTEKKNYLKEYQREKKERKLKLKRFLEPINLSRMGLHHTCDDLEGWTPTTTRGEE